MKKEFPTYIKKSDKEKEHEIEESTRALFIHHVMIENPALVKEITPFIIPEGISFPPAYKAFTVILENYTKTTTHVKDKDERSFLFSYSAIERASKFFSRPNSIYSH